VSDGPRVSIVATVRDEAPGVGEWLDALLCQSRRPDEIVVVDGGSTDGTIEELERRTGSSRVPVVVQSAPGLNIAQGRNLGIALASGNILAITDAGTIADVDWLERLIEPIVKDAADLAAGFFVPRLDSAWRRALAAATLPDRGEIDPASFRPSSRSVAIRKSWLTAGLRYPEWLDYCEDLVWDLALRRAGARFAFVPDATVTFDVRPSPAAFAVQYFRYARGDGKAGLYTLRHLLRYATYAVLIVVLVRRRPAELAFTAYTGAHYVRRPIKRLWARDRLRGVAWRQSLLATPAVIGLRALGDLAKMAGYPAGLRWRWRRFGAIDYRTSWNRVSPSGDVFRPAALSRESRPPTLSPDV
jgi:cellulose synthase/poly-beta-1,6-N-acetylglucosamine synthase-like glycosyltransferase